MGTEPSTNEGERISVQILVLYEKLLQVHSIEKSCEQSMFILFSFCELFHFFKKFIVRKSCVSYMNVCIIK